MWTGGADAGEGPLGELTIRDVGPEFATQIEGFEQAMLGDETTAATLQGLFDSPRSPRVPRFGHQPRRPSSLWESRTPGRSPVWTPTRVECCSMPCLCTSTTLRTARTTSGNCTTWRPGTTSPSSTPGRMSQPMVPPGPYARSQLPCHRTGRDALVQQGQLTTRYGGLHGSFFSPRPRRADHRWRPGYRGRYRPRLCRGGSRGSRCGAYPG